MIAMAVLALSATSAFAQYSAGDFTIQPKVGLNVANMTKLDTDKDDSGWKAGLAVGVEGEYHFYNWFGLSVGAMYSQKGAKETTKWSSGKLDYKWKLDYIDVPVLANFYVAKGLALKVGLQPSFKVSAKHELSGTVEGEKGSASEKMSGFKSFVMEAPIGISYEYAGFCLDARYTLGASDVMENYNYKNQVFQLTLGYKFKLK